MARTYQELLVLADKNLEAIAELRIEQKKTDEQMKKTDEKLERMGIHLGGISNNNGEMAEEFFYSSFDKNKTLGEIKYDDVGRNWIKKRGNLEEEFDIILTNGKELAVIEVKYKAHSGDVKKLERKVENFKKLFPIYKDFSIKGGLASMSIPKETESEVLEKGFFVLKQQGTHMEVTSPKLLK